MQNDSDQEAACLAACDDHRERLVNAHARPDVCLRHAKLCTVAKLEDQYDGFVSPCRACIQVSVQDLAVE